MKSSQPLHPVSRYIASLDASGDVQENFSNIVQPSQWILHTFEDVSGFDVGDEFDSQTGFVRGRVLEIQNSRRILVETFGTPRIRENLYINGTTVLIVARVPDVP